MNITMIKNLIWVGLLLLLVGTTYYKGRHDVQVKWDLEKIEAEKEIAELRAKSEQVTVKEVIRYVESVKVIKEKGDTIYVKVPEYVTVKDDSNCVVNNGFVRLWNFANKNIVPDAARSTDEEASLVKLSDVAKQHTREATICRATEEQLIGLQNWIREQQKLYETKSASTDNQ